MLIDLHVHTRLSRDANAAIEDYLALASAQSAGASSGHLGAICLTEHRLFPTQPEIDRQYGELRDRHGIAIFKGIEADTDLGHLILFGVTPSIMKRFDLGGRMLKSELLIEVIHDQGGIAIPAHPFRDSGFGNHFERLTAKLGPALSAIEVVNGQNSREQNERAADAAAKFGLTALGGSDAHFASTKWFLTCATELEREVATIEELCVELRAGRARPYLFS